MCERGVARAAWSSPTSSSCQNSSNAAASTASSRDGPRRWRAGSVGSTGRGAARRSRERAGADGRDPAVVGDHPDAEDQRRPATQVGDQADERDALEAAESDRRGRVVLDLRVRVAGPREIHAVLRRLVGPGSLETLLEIDEVHPQGERGALLPGHPGRVVIEGGGVVRLGDEGAGARLRLRTVAGDEQAAGAGRARGSQRGDCSHTQGSLGHCLLTRSRFAARRQRSRWVASRITAAGVTPLMRDAWPTERGRAAASFSTTSCDRPGMARVVEVGRQRQLAPAAAPRRPRPPGGAGSPRT